MAQQVWKVSIGIELQTKELQKQFWTLKSTVNKQMKWVNQQVKKSSLSMTKTLWALAWSYAVLKTVDAVKKLWTAIVKSAANFESTTMAFETMLWSWIKAKQLLEDLENFSKKTPFKLVDIEQNAKLLLWMGIEADKLIPTMKAMWDVASWLNVPLERIALNFWQIKAQWKLTGRELRDFAVAWVPLLDELAKNFEKSKVEIQWMVSAGKIWFKDVEKAFTTMSSSWGRFADMMLKQAKTFNWMVSILQDTVNIAFRKNGEKMLEVARKVVSWLNSIAEKYLPIIVWYFSDAITKITYWWEQWGGQIIASIFWVFKEIWIWLAEFSSTVIEWFSILFWWIAKDWEASAKDINRVIAYITKSFWVLIKWVISVVKASSELMAWFVVDFIMAFSKIAEWWQKLLTVFKEIWKAIPSMLSAWFDKAINEVIDGINFFVKQANKIPKVNMNLLDRRWVKDTKDNIWNIKNAFDDFKNIDLFENTKSSFDKAWEIMNNFAETSLEWYIELETKFMWINDDIKKDTTKTFETIWKTIKKVWEWEWSEWLSKEMSKLQDKLKKVWQGYRWLSAVWKKSLEDLTTKNREAQRKIVMENAKATKAFLELKNEIQGTGWAIDKLNQELTKDIADIDLWLAESFVEERRTIEEELKAIKKQASEDWMTSDLQEEKDKLLKRQKYLEQFAIDNKALKEQIATAEIEANKTAFQRFAEEQANRKTLLETTTQTKIDELNKQVEDEKVKLDALLEKNREMTDNMQTEFLKQRESMALTWRIADKLKDRYNKAMKSIETQTESSVKTIEQQLARMQRAMSRINSLRSDKWFATGGYTGDGGIFEKAGIVHKWEYVVPQFMTKAMPWLVRWLENIRTWNTNNDNSRNIEVGAMNFADSFDGMEFLQQLNWQI